MNYAEAYVKFMCQWLLDNCIEDMEFMDNKFDKGCIARLQNGCFHPLYANSIYRSSGSPRGGNEEWQEA